MAFDNSSSPGSVFATLAAGSLFKLAASYFISKPQASSTGTCTTDTNATNDYRLVGRVSALYCYPIKSFRGMQVQEGDCTALGLKCYGVTDRHWTVATSNGVYLTQRQEPTMALISVEVKGDMIELNVPGMEPITLPTDPPVTEERLSKVTVKTDTVTSLDCGDEIADWLCRYFKREGLRLHFSAPSLEKRDCSKHKKHWNHPAKPGVDFTALSDYCGYVVLSNPSLVALNQKLTKSVPITNFRANIIVDGCPAFEEDNWIALRIGEAELRALDACTRCVLVTVDQEKGVKDENEEPLATLKKFRLKEPYGQKPAFGVNFTLDKPGVIHVGDPIYAKCGRHLVSAK